MWGSDSNIIFKVPSEAFLVFNICFPVEHPYWFFLNVFFVTNWKTNKRSTQNYSSEPHKKICVYNDGAFRKKRKFHTSTFEKKFLWEKGHPPKNAKKIYCCVKSDFKSSILSQRFFLKIVIFRFDLYEIQITLS